MPKQKTPVVLRIRTLTDDPNAPRWLVGGTRYSLRRAHQRAEELRRTGRVVHVDLAEWHR